MKANVTVFSVESLKVGYKLKMALIKWQIISKVDKSKWKWKCCEIGRSKSLLSPWNWGLTSQACEAKPPKTCPFVSLISSRVGPRFARPATILVKLSPCSCVENTSLQEALSGNYEDGYLNRWINSKPKWCIMHTIQHLTVQYIGLVQSLCLSDLYK